MAANNKDRYGRARVGNIESLEKRELFAVHFGLAAAVPVEVAPVTPNIDSESQDTDHKDWSELSCVTLAPTPNAEDLQNGRTDRGIPKQSNELDNKTHAELAERCFDRAASGRTSEVDARIADWEESMI